MVAKQPAQESAVAPREGLHECFVFFELRVPTQSSRAFRWNAGR
jgi:hypothetical protein